VLVAAALPKRRTGVSEGAIAENADKPETLQRPEDADADWLPVVDGNRRFIGGIDRSRLTASLILDVANRLKQP
jgi:hypothetical protein